MDIKRHGRAVKTNRQMHIDLPRFVLREGFTTNENNASKVKCPIEQLLDARKEAQNVNRETLIPKTVECLSIIR